MFGRSLVFVFLGAIAAIFVANEISRSFVSYSGDAFVTTDMVAVAPTVTGRLATVSVVDDQWVAEGAPLFAIDPEPYSLALESAKASLQLAEASQETARDTHAEAAMMVAAAKAVFDDAQATEGRIKTLFDQGVVPQQRLDDVIRDLDQARADYRAAEAAAVVAKDRIAESAVDIAVATAARDLAAYNLSQASVTAPMSGFVAPFRARAGAYLDEGDQVLAIVSNSQWRVVVNLPEQRLANLAVGQPAWMTIASNPWVVVRGRVKSVSRGISRSPVGPSVLPYVAPTTEWIRLSRRFPVEISFDDPDRLTLFAGADARVLIHHTAVEPGTDRTVPIEAEQP